MGFSNQKPFDVVGSDVLVDKVLEAVGIVAQIFVNHSRSSFLVLVKTLQKVARHA